MTQASAPSHVCTFGAEVILKHLNALEQEIEGARLAEDTECIHRMRVATRRLRNALSLFADCFSQKKAANWQNSIKKITRSLGQARDMDVQLIVLEGIFAQLPERRYRPGIRRILVRLRQRRQKLQHRVINALEELEKSGIIFQMRERLNALAGFAPEPTNSYSHELYQRAQLAITQKLDELLSYEPYIFDPSKIEELHAMRISAKRLRYTLEVFAPLYSSNLRRPIQAVRQIQEILGIIHDCDVWITTLPKFIDKEKKRTTQYYGHLQPFNLLVPGIQYFLADRQETREKEYHRFVNEWKQWEKAALWEKLRQTVTQPVLSMIEIYPSSAQKSANNAPRDDSNAPNAQNSTPFQPENNLSLAQDNND